LEGRFLQKVVVTPEERGNLSKTPQIPEKHSCGGGGRKDLKWALGNGICDKDEEEKKTNQKVNSPQKLNLFPGGGKEKLYKGGNFKRGRPIGGQVCNGLLLLKRMGVERRYCRDCIKPWWKGI